MKTMQVIQEVARHQELTVAIAAGQSPGVSKWDRRFLELALMVGSWSKDPSTKCGAVIVAPDKRIVSTGYNGFPRKLQDADELLLDREEKLSRTIHCEMNALLHAEGFVEGFTLYGSQLSCDRCAVHMIQAGIQFCVAPIPTGRYAENWADSVERTRSYYREAGVRFREIDVDTWTYRNVE